jgi:hypothetical protein
MQHFWGLSDPQAAQPQAVVFQKNATLLAPACSSPQRALDRSASSADA